MQSFVLTIRHVAELTTEIADWLSRLEQRYFEDVNNHIDLLEEDIECLLILTLKLNEVHIYTPTVNFEQLQNVIKPENDQEIKMVLEP